MSECILHTKSTDRDGYGQLVVNGKRYLAHRLSYCNHNGLEYSDIKGKLVRHKCDNPTCINPTHLELGTHADNMVDRNTRGRAAKGTTHGRVKLTEVDVQAIRSTYIKGSTTHGCPALAKTYGVTFQTIHKIVNNHRWL